MIEKYINDYEKECYRGVDESTPFKELEFHFVPRAPLSMDERPDIQHALHTNLGSLTVLDRMTGFGFRDTETGWREHGTGSMGLVANCYTARK